MPPLECCRHQTQPGGELTTVGEVLRIPNARHQGAGGDGADAGNGLQLAAGFLRLGPALNLRFDLPGLAVQFLEMAHEPVNQFDEDPGELPTGLIKQQGHALGKMVDALGQDEPILGQKPADLVGLCRAGFDEPPGARGARREWLAAPGS